MEKPVEFNNKFNSVTSAPFLIPGANRESDPKFQNCAAAHPRRGRSKALGCVYLLGN
jgi:hypothetical protein